jgi:mono/diheme cytochrome c family protein
MSTPMMRRCVERLAAALVISGFLSTLAACERHASGLTEWTPADHDHQTEPKGRRANAAVAQQRKANPHSPPSQRNQVIDVTWTKQCATCHGKRGKGDGPSSTMVKARDLTNAEFQASMTDEQMKKVIREGKDKMPAFNLPESVLDGLVAQVRSFAKKPQVVNASDLQLRPPPEQDPDADEADDEAPAAPAAAPNAPAKASAPAAPAPANHAPANHGATDTAAPLPTRAPPTQAPANPGAAQPSAPPAR